MVCGRQKWEKKCISDLYSSEIEIVVVKARKASRESGIVVKNGNVLFCIHKPLNQMNLNILLSVHGAPYDWLAPPLLTIEVTSWVTKPLTFRFQWPNSPTHLNLIDIRSIRPNNKTPILWGPREVLVGEGRLALWRRHLLGLDIGLKAQTLKLVQIIWREALSYINFELCCIVCLARGN